MNEEYSNEGVYSHSDVSDIIRKYDKQKINSKKNYIIIVGQKLLNDPELNLKWEKFVQDCIDGFGEGVLLEETLMILGLIKSGLDYTDIQDVLSQIGSYATILNYLGGFVHPEIIDCINPNRKVL